MVVGGRWMVECGTGLVVGGMWYWWVDGGRWWVVDTSLTRKRRHIRYFVTIQTSLIFTMRLVLPAYSTLA